MDFSPPPSPFSLKTQGHSEDGMVVAGLGPRGRLGAATCGSPAAPSPKHGAGGAKCPVAEQVISSLPSWHTQGSFPRRVSFGLHQGFHVISTQ